MYSGLLIPNITERYDNAGAISSSLNTTNPTIITSIVYAQPIIAGTLMLGNFFFRYFSRSSNIPCHIPQMRYPHAAPCQIPVAKNTIKIFTYTFPRLLPPRGMYT